MRIRDVDATCLYDMYMVHMRCLYDMYMVHMRHRPLMGHGSWAVCRLIG